MEVRDFHGRGEQLVPASGAPEGGHRAEKALAMSLTRPCARTAVFVTWAVLGVCGLAIAPRFILVLQSDVPPVAGMPSYEAQTAYNKYFPVEPLSGALLLKTRGGSPFLEFANRSTCNLTRSYTFDLANKSIAINYSCHNESALGGGCVIKSDIAESVDRLIIDMTEKELGNILPKAAVQKIQADFLKKAQAALEQLPNSTLCPVASRSPELTADFFNFIASVAKQTTVALPGLDTKVLSFAAIPSMNVSKVATVPVQALGTTLNLTVTFSAAIPAGLLWDAFQSQFMADGLSTALVATQMTALDGHQVLPIGPDAHSISQALKDVAKDAPASIDAKVNTMGLLFESIQAGINNTMDMSTMTLPVALLILAGMVRNLRFILITLINLVACVTTAILIEYPFAAHITTATTAPALMVAIALAMSIDYSLFLLTRFQAELDAGRSVLDAVVVMLSTSGHIVLVSGITLLLCFLTMLCLPVHFISSMGISAAITVFTAVIAALTLTPALLLTCPAFFSSNKRWGVTSEGSCCRRRSLDDAPNVALVAPSAGGLGHARALQPGPGDRHAGHAAARPEAGEEEKSGRSCWTAFGTQVQRLSLLVGAVLLATAAPTAYFSLREFDHSVGLVPMMPSDAVATKTLMELQAAFGVGALFPTTLIVVPPQGAMDTEISRAAWLAKTCAALQSVAVAVAAVTPSSAPPFTAGAFNGAMILNGRCSASGLASPGQWSNVGRPYSATKVMVSYQIDPFSATGQVWIEQLRSALRAPNGASAGEWFVFGVGPIQMDVAKKTFARLPLLVALMMCVVFVVIGVAFKSLVAPFRAVLCLLWMLIITFGLAIFVFQNGWLDFLNMPQVGMRSTGAMSWMSPCIAFPVVVGLGLDYDIFYSERVLEERGKGYPDRVAAVRALAATADAISAAGCIMVVAFFSLLLSTTPTLNEIAFLLVVGVLIDCFVTTKVIIPCAVALLGPASFWPRRWGGASMSAATPQESAAGLRSA